ncbi:MAG: hypothetical protein QM484_12220 [Woeseiaceae bacterium]
MNIKIAIIFSAFIMLQACGSKGMMHSAAPADLSDEVLMTS